jgi:hypothetical protein
MAAATASTPKPRIAKPARKRPSGNRFAISVATDHDLTLDELRKLLDDYTIMERTRFRPDRQNEVADLVASKTASKPDTPDPRQNGAGSAALVTTRRRKSKGAFEPTRLMRRSPLRLTPADRMTLNTLQTVLAGVARRLQLPRVSESRGRGVVVQDVLFPDRWIPMFLPEFQKRSDEGTLPPLHEKTKEELAQPLSRLSLVNHTCRICNEEMEPPAYRGMLENLLAGNCVLPFRPNDRKALKYPEHHKGCSSILKMMSRVEVGLVSMPEGDAKEAARLRRYREELEANGGRLLSEYMKSEYKPLSGIKAMARVRAIQDHVTRQRELLS